jgi:AsmA protein
MRRGLIALAIALLVVLAGLAAVLLNPPVGFLQNRLAAEIKSSTGRDLTVAGRASLQILPSIVLRLEDATLSNPPGFAGDPFLRAGAVEAHAALWPLLQGRLDIDRVSLANPRLQLVIDQQGKKSWEFPAASRPETTPTALPVIGELAVTAGTVTFKDERVPARAELADINATAERVSLDAPLSVTFDVRWNNEKIEGKANTQSLALLASGAATRTAITLASAKGNAEAEGELTAAEPVHFQGKMKGSTPSLRATAAWFDIGLPTAQGFGKSALEGDMKADAKSVAFSNARLSLDDTNAEGTLSIDFARTPPLVTGTVAADRIDAARYIPAAKPGLTRAAPAPVFEIEAVPLNESLKAYLKAAETKGPVAAATPEALGLDITRAPQPAWSTEPFDVKALKAVDADLDLSVRALKYNKAEVNVPKLAVAVKDGKLSLESKELATHGGKLTGRGVLDAKPGVPTFAASVSVDDVDVHGLLSDLGYEGYVDGKTTGEAEVSGAGRNERDVVSSLKGRLTARVGKGVVVGYDVKRAIETWKLPPYNAAASTPFERIDADLKMDKGVAQSTVMELAGPVVGAKADGTARLLTRQLDYNARVSFPNWWSIAVRIFGPFTQLKYDVDWWSTLFSRQTPAATRMSVAQGLNLKDPELAGMLERAIEKAESTPTRSPDDFDPEILRALLKSAKGE